MSQYFDLNSPLRGIQPPVKRSVFVSYHHGGDQPYYNAFIEAFDETYNILFDNSLERRIDSDNINYVLQRIRDSFVKGSSCTIVLCGAETPWRKYVDWEIKATLNMEHGLIGVNLPTNGPNTNGRVTVPNRLHDNIQCGFAIWTNWAAFTSSAASVKATIEQAIARPTRLASNGREMMSRNEIPPWKR
jgi:hypothetical protein